jgi:DNA excision repair protein ERCC-4
LTSRFPSHSLEANDVATLGPLLVMGEEQEVVDLDFIALEDQFGDYYGLLVPEETVLIRAYSDDSDDRVLSEINPRFIVMFEPNMEFIRRIEVWLI